MNEPLKETISPKKTKKSNITQLYWWDKSNKSDLKDTKSSSEMIQLIRAIQENQKPRQWQFLKYGFMYTNRHNDLVGINSSLPDRYAVTYNVVKSCVDTVAAKIAKNYPRPRIITEKGDHVQQLRAKNLSKYVDGLFYESKTYRTGVQVFKDSGIFGTGVMKITPDWDEGKLCYERVLINEIVVDDLDGAYGNPKTIYQVRKVSKYALIEEFPEHMDAINANGPDNTGSAQAKTLDVITVFEGWHLGDDAGPGRHILAIDGGKLIDEVWELDTFPFAFLRYNSHVTSFYGQGIAEELMGTQLEINKILRDIQRAQNLIAVPRVLLEYNSNVIGSHLNNEIGSAIKYKGVKPDFFTPTAMNNEIYNHVKWLIQSAYEKVGVSQLSASSKKPAGLDSGQALRDYQDIESERFALTSENYNNFFLDAADISIKLSRLMYTTHEKSIKVKVSGQKFIETIDWKDVDLEDDAFIMKMYSASLFPTQPAAKLQQAKEYIQAGWMDRDTAIQLMDFPDIEAWETQETAVKEFTEKCIGNILEGKKYIPPEPELLLTPEPVNQMKKAYINALQNEVDIEKTELMLRWIEQASSLLPPPPAPTAPPMAVTPITPEQGAVQGTPQPLPQGDLIPQQ